MPSRLNTYSDVLVDSCDRSQEGPKTIAATGASPTDSNTVAIEEIEPVLPDLAEAIRNFLKKPTGNNAQECLTKAVKFGARLLLRQDALKAGQTCKTQRFTGRTLVEGGKLCVALQEIGSKIDWTGKSLVELFRAELDRSAKSIWHKTQVNLLIGGIQPYAYCKQEAGPKPQQAIVQKQPVAVAPAVWPKADRRKFLELRNLQLDGKHRAFQCLVEQTFDRLTCNLSRNYSRFIARRDGARLACEAEVLLGRAINKLRVRPLLPTSPSISLAV